MPEFKSLEVPVEPKKDALAECAPCDVGRNKYGWNTEITLEDKVLERFPGLVDAKADEEVKIEAKAFISKIESEDLTGGKKRRKVQIQLTALDISRDPDKERKEGFDTATA